MSDPDGILRGHDLRRPPFDLDRADDLVCLRIDAGDTPVGLVGDPGRPFSEGDLMGVVAD